MRTLIISVVSIVALIVISVTLITIFRPESDISPIIAILAPTIAAIGSMGAVALVKGDTAKMTNGFMDKKIQDNVRLVMTDKVLDPHVSKALDEREEF